MSTFFRLNDAARERLKAQVNLTGTFHHTLRNAERASVTVAVEIEQCDKALQATVRGGPFVNSVTLAKAHRMNAARLCRFIEASTNGYSCGDVGLEVGESELVTDVESSLRYALRLGRGTHYFEVDELDVCVQMAKTTSGNPVAVLEIDDVQVQRALPRDRRAAFEALREDLARLTAGHRAALAA